MHTHICARNTLIDMLSPCWHFAHTQAKLRIGKAFSVLLHNTIITFAPALFSYCTALFDRWFCST